VPERLVWAPNLSKRRVYGRERSEEVRAKLSLRKKTMKGVSMHGLKMWREKKEEKKSIKEFTVIFKVHHLI